MGTPPSTNAYEAEREARIAANRARLAGLGLAAPPRRERGVWAGDSEPRRDRKRVKRPAQAAHAVS